MKKGEEKKKENLEEKGKKTNGSIATEKMCTKGAKMVCEE
jgi:hypothetical protein